MSESNSYPTHEEIMLEGGFKIVNTAKQTNSSGVERKTTTSYQGLSWKKKRRNLNISETIDYIEFNPVKLESSLRNMREKLSSFIFPIIEKQFIKQLICYGIGDFLTDKIALSQFHVLLSIMQQYREKFNETLTCYMYDPIFEIKMLDTEREKLYSYLKEKHAIHWVERNEECKRRVDQVTFFYMPHCAFSMYYNLLMENSEHLHNIILLSNQLPLKHAILREAYSVDEKKQMILSATDDQSSSEKLIFHKKKGLDDTEKYLLNFVFNNTNIYIFHQNDTAVTQVENVSANIFALDSDSIQRHLNRENDKELLPSK